MKYDKARKNPASFPALTSVSISLFDEILPFFTDAHDEYFRWHDIKGKRLTRRRRHVIRSDSPLSTVAERLFFLLTYLKNNLTQEYHAAMSGMSQQCGRWIHTLTDILRLSLDEAGVLPANTVPGFKRLLDQRGGEYVVNELIHDGTEREIPGPSDPGLQKVCPGQCNHIAAYEEARRKETDRWAESVQRRNIENAYKGGTRCRRCKNPQNRKGRMQIAQE